MSMLVTKEELKELAYGYNPDGFIRVHHEIMDTTRWEIIYYMVFRFEETGKYFEYGYSEGATELQDSSSFDYEDENVIVEEVFPVQVMRTEYTRSRPEAIARLAENLR